MPKSHEIIQLDPKKCDIFIPNYVAISNSWEEVMSADSDWDLDGRALASGQWLHVFHLAPLSWSLSSLYFPLRREMPKQQK